jgi:hypothetical protein
LALSNFKIICGLVDYKKEIKNQVYLLCAENNININKQNYKILIFNETLKPSNNIFTSGSRKTLSFYGRVYLDIDKKIKEKIYGSGVTQEFEILPNSLIIMSSGTHSSTELTEDVDILSFYVAPSSLVDSFHFDNWELM